MNPHARLWHPWLRIERLTRLAVAASMLTAAYHMLKYDVEYRDLGADHFDRRDKAKLANRLTSAFMSSASPSKSGRRDSSHISF